MKEFNPEHLHIAAFARGAGRYAGEQRLAHFHRLVDETKGVGSENYVTYAVRGEVQEDASGQAQVWLHLEGSVTLPLVCQRCLGPVEVAVSFDRSFRFVATEAQAEIEDDASEEDVLVLSRDFDLLELLEDELLMAMPAAPTHEQCPVAIKMQVIDANFEDSAQSQPHPFSVLAALKKSPDSEH
jgi:uncharacterized protein